MNKRTEVHVLAVIKSLEQQLERLQAQFAPLQARMEALDNEIDEVSVRLGHARALLGVDAPEQGPAPQNAPAPILDGGPIGETAEQWQETLAHAVREEAQKVEDTPVGIPAAPALSEPDAEKADKEVDKPAVSTCAHSRTYTRKGGVRRCVVCHEEVTTR